MKKSTFKKTLIVCVLMVGLGLMHTGNFQALAFPQPAVQLRITDARLVTISPYVYSVNVSWSIYCTVNPPVRIYLMVREISQTGTGQWVPIAHLPSTTASGTSVHVRPTNGIAYQYQIHAVSTTIPKQGTVYSNYRIVSIPAIPPPAPSDVRAIPLAYNEVRITWVANNPLITRFLLERRAPNKDNQWNIIDYNIPASTQFYTDRNLSPATVYEYRVYAEGNFPGGRVCSDIASARTPAIPPSTPTNLRVRNVSSNEITIEWNHVSGYTDGFKVERRQIGAPGLWSRIADLVDPACRIYTDKNLEFETTYSYRVKAYNANEESGFSNDTTKTTWLHTPTSFNVSALSPREIELSWVDNSAKEHGFTIRRFDGQWDEIDTTRANATGYCDRSVVSGKFYRYQVRAFNSSLDTYSSYTAIISVVAPLVAPADFTATAVSPTKTRLDWQKNAITVEEFVIERSLTGLDRWDLLVTIDNPNQLNYYDTSISEGVNYYYRIKARNSNTESTYSYATLHIDPLLPAPANFRGIAISPTEIRFNWDYNSEAEDGFHLYRSDDGSSFVPVKIVPADSISCTDTGLAEGTFYYYKICAYNEFGESQPSDIIHIQTITVPDELVVISGSNQTGNPETQLGEPLVVQLLDTNGNPMPGEEIQFNCNDGILSEYYIFTDELGQAKVNFRLGQLPEGQQFLVHAITAVALNLPTKPVEFTAYVNNLSFNFTKVWDLAESYSHLFGENNYQVQLLGKGDLDRDQRKEIYVGAYVYSDPRQTPLLIFEENGDDSYSLIWTCTDIVSYFQASAYGDIDRDQEDELVVGAGNCIYVVDAIGNDTFILQLAISSVAVLREVTINDLDSDSLPEIIVTKRDGLPGDSDMCFFEHNGPIGDYSFTEIFKFTDAHPLSLNDFSIGDSDSDSQKDIPYKGYKIPMRIYWLEHNAATGHVDEKVSEIGNWEIYPQNFLIADLDSDGLNEIFARGTSVGQSHLFGIESTGDDAFQLENWKISTAGRYGFQQLSKASLSNLENPAIFAVEYSTLLEPRPDSTVCILSYLDDECTLVHKFAPNAGGIFGLEIDDLDKDEFTDVVLEVHQSREGEGIFYNIVIFEDKQEGPKIPGGPAQLLTADLNGNGLGDIVVDYGTGSGIWVGYDNGVWENIYDKSAKSTVIADLNADGKDEIIFDFGPSKNYIWVKYHDHWENIYGMPTEQMVTIDSTGDGRKDTLIVDFGEPHGLYLLNNTTGVWENICGLDPINIIVGDLDGNNLDDLIIDFGEAHNYVWVRFDNGSWGDIYGISPDFMITAQLDQDDKADLILDFGPVRNGLWILYGDGTLANLYPTSPDSITVGKLNANDTDELIMDLGPSKGLWVSYDNNPSASFPNIHELCPVSITIGDLNNNGQDEVIAYFGPTKGIWVYYDGTTWQHLHSE